MSANTRMRSTLIFLRFTLDFRLRSECTNSPVSFHPGYVKTYSAPNLYNSLNGKHEAKRSQWNWN